MSYVCHRDIDPIEDHKDTLLVSSFFLPLPSSLRNVPSRVIFIEGVSQRMVSKQNEAEGPFDLLWCV